MTNDTWKFWNDAEEMMKEIFPNEKKLKKDNFFMIRMGMEINSIRNKGYSKEDAINFVHTSLTRLKLEFKYLRKEFDKEIEDIYGTNCNKLRYKTEDSYESYIDFIDNIPKNASIQLYLDDDDLPDSLSDDVIILINCQGNKDLRIKGDTVLIYSDKGFVCKRIHADDILIISSTLTAETIRGQHVGICTNKKNIMQLKVKTPVMECLPTNNNVWDFDKLTKQFENFLSDKWDDIDTEAEIDDLENIQLINFGNIKNPQISPTSCSMGPVDNELSALLDQLSATSLKEIFGLLSLDHNNGTKEQMKYLLLSISRLAGLENIKPMVQAYIQSKKTQQPAQAQSQPQQSSPAPDSQQPVVVSKAGGKLTA